MCGPQNQVPGFKSQFSVMNSVTLGKLSASGGLSSPICKRDLIRTYRIGLLGGFDGFRVSKHPSTRRTIILMAPGLGVPTPQSSRLTKPRAGFREKEGAGRHPDPTEGLAGQGQGVPGADQTGLGRERRPGAVPPRCHQPGVTRRGPPGQLGGAVGMRAKLLGNRVLSNSLKQRKVPRSPCRWLFYILQVRSRC